MIKKQQVSYSWVRLYTQTRFKIRQSPSYFCPSYFIWCHLWISWSLKFHTSRFCLYSAELFVWRLSTGHRMEAPTAYGDACRIQIHAWSSCLTALCIPWHAIRRWRLFHTSGRKHLVTTQNNTPSKYFDRWVIAFMRGHISRWTDKLIY